MSALEISLPYGNCIKAAKSISKMNPVIPLSEQVRNCTTLGRDSRCHQLCCGASVIFVEKSVWRIEKEVFGR